MVEGEEKYKQSMNALAKSNEALGKSAGGLGDQIKELSGKMGIQLPEGATKALNSLNGFSAGTVAAMGAAAAGVAAFIKICKELHELTLQAAADADALVTQSMVTGLSTETLQQWSYASELIDVSVSTMTGSLTKLTKAMYDASTGNAQVAEAFSALGVSVTDADGNLRDAQDVFLEVIDALGEVGNQTERDALTMDLFGRSAQELNPLILQGSDALRELADEAENAGYVLDESQIQKLTEVDDAYQRMQLQVEATQKKLALEFAPASKAAMETFGDAVQKAGQLLVDSHLIENAAAIVTQIMNIIDAASDFASLIPGWMNPIERLSNTLKGLAAVAAMVADALNAVGSLMRLDFNGVKTSLGLNIGSGQMSNLQKLKYGDSWTYYDGGWNTTRSGAVGYDSSKGLWYDKNGNYMYNAAGTQNWRGGLTWVGESGPELVSLPQGSRIYNAQESRAAASPTVVATDLSQIEQLLGDVLSALRDKRVIGRMA